MAPAPVPDGLWDLIAGAVTGVHLSELEHGEREPGLSVLAISREVGKSVDWLLTGEGRK